MADERARALRKTMTRQEVRLWLSLRALRQQGYHFRRQVPAGPYVLDFACLRARLAVEIDGEHHGFDAQRHHDEVRDAALRGMGLKTVRFWNHEVAADIDGVVETILAAARPRLDAYQARASTERA